MAVEEFPLQLSRHAFSPRDVARAGDLWRLLQDAAVLGSSRRGWPPERYRREHIAFVVRTMTVCHHRESVFGETLRVQTWVDTFKRGMFTDRQIRVTHDAEPITSATQRWVHVVLPELKPARASDALIESFGLEVRDPGVELPVWRSVEGPPLSFELEAWHTWMDPLAHANHPAYIDWIDESLARAMARGGLDPQAAIARAERLTFRSGVLAPERVQITSQLVGITEAGDAVIQHAITGGDGRICADGHTVRALAGGETQALIDVLSGS
ncbi:MAG TPA: acyl-CoA thioesterase [Deltaproteobacteria bacterium]|nr:acyl-CoA thioesterase [Deltaproteobacteria bacterium]